MHKSRNRRTESEKRTQGQGRGQGQGRAQARIQQRTKSGAGTEAGQEVRLQKFLADHGVASRRKSEELISRGLVKVNGATVTALGTKVTPGRDKVVVDGQLIRPRRTNENHCYYILNKPRGFLVTADDPEG